MQNFEIDNNHEAWKAGGPPISPDFGLNINPAPGPSFIIPTDNVWANSNTTENHMEHNKEEEEHVQLGLIPVDQDEDNTTEPHPGDNTSHLRRRHDAIEDNSEQVSD